MRIWDEVLAMADHVRSISLARWRRLAPLPWRERMGLWWQCGGPSGCCCPWCCSYCRIDYMEPRDGE